MDVKKNKRPLSYTFTLVWYQLMLFGGVGLVISAIYFISRGEVEAALLFLPGVISLVGGMIIRKGLRRTFND
jgi:hypothetical protein